MNSTFEVALYIYILRTLVRYEEIEKETRVAIIELMCYS